MDERTYRTGAEVAALFNLPAILTDLPGGGFQVEKAGVVGTGPTPYAAIVDWGRKFAAMIMLPKPLPPELPDAPP